MAKKDKFIFEISLSVLNHLGRNLYRSFITILGEAISNSWDADANNVWLYIDRDKNNFFIKDDGDGMTNSDFQEKFLKIGYSKRKDGKLKSKKGRPFIGRKGIGKLALLSCAEKITVISKTKETDYIGGMIDNSDLDDAIKKDLTPEKYPLSDWNISEFDDILNKHKKGTVLRFENLKEGIKNSLPYLKKAIALNFKFSLIDENFNIFVNDEKITYEHLSELAYKTQFLWNINDLKDPYLSSLSNVKQSRTFEVDDRVSGFIASVIKPRDLKVINVDERVAIDLYVNGRLREKDLLKHIPTSRIVENYLYGQIHFNDLDDKEFDRFTSSREGIVADDPKFKELLDILSKKIISVIIEEWDIWRLKGKETGDSDNLRILPKDRKAKELYNVISDEYILPNESVNKKKVDIWVSDLEDDASYNLSSYAECFISENLIRKYIQEKNLPFTKSIKAEITNLLDKEKVSKKKGNINIDIRRANSKLSYLSMDNLAIVADKPKDINKDASLLRDAKEYKPIRDAVAHTALLTDIAKIKLSSVYENIKGRIRTLLS